MPIDPELWQEMFTLDTIPMCPEGMQLAEVFLAACGRAVERADIEDERATFIAAWDAVMKHANNCDNCNEV